MRYPSAHLSFPMQICRLKPFSTNPTKWSNTLKQFAGCCRRMLLPTNCLSVFEHFVGLPLKGSIILLTNINSSLHSNHSNFNLSQVFAKTKNLCASKKPQHDTKPFALIYWSSFKSAFDSYQHLLREAFPYSPYNQLHANRNKIFRFTWHLFN